MHQTVSDRRKPVPCRVVPGAQQSAAIPGSRVVARLLRRRCRARWRRWRRTSRCCTPTGSRPVAAPACWRRRSAVPQGPPLPPPPAPPPTVQCKLLFAGVQGLVAGFTAKAPAYPALQVLPAPPPAPRQCCDFVFLWAPATPTAVSPTVAPCATITEAADKVGPSRRSIAAVSPTLCGMVTLKPPNS